MEVLKDEALRKEYDRVLVDGMPTMRHARAAYFRASAKIGLTGVSAHKDNIKKKQL